MARTKLKRLLKVKKFRNVFSGETISIKEGIQNYFSSGNRFSLEIGCGHGDYSVELAKKFPERNFVGIDVKGARIYHGAMRSIDDKLDNVGFIIGKAEKLNEFFQPKSVEEIIIPFPDPHMRRSNQNRRLISPNFLIIYKALLTDYGTIHFKTDNQSLFEYVGKVISRFGCKILCFTDDLCQTSENSHLEIVTNYEKHYIKLGRRIKYIHFKF